MTFKVKTYEEIRDDMLMQLTKGIIKEKHTFTKNRFKYLLSNKEVKDIVLKLKASQKGYLLYLKKTRITN